MLNLISNGEIVHQSDYTIFHSQEQSFLSLCPHRQVGEVFMQSLQGTGAGRYCGCITAWQALLAWAGAFSLLTCSLALSFALSSVPSCAQ